MTPPTAATAVSRTRSAATAVPLVRPFAGLRPDPSRAALIAAPPYDVLTTEQARALALDNPLSFLHVSRPEIDFPPGADPRAPEVYGRAGDNLRRMIQAGALRRDSAPAYYVYRMTAGDHVQTGVVAAASLAAYEANRIRRHEVTRPDKVDDRTRQIEAVGAQTGPVLVIHRANDEVDALLRRASTGPPDVGITGRDGVGHTLWAVSGRDDVARLTRAFDAMDALYIADGHHRSAAAAAVAARRREANPDHRGDEPYNFFLVVSFPDDQLQILEYNRVVRDLDGRSPDEMIEAVRARFELEPSPAPVRPEAAHVFGMYLAGGWFRLRPRDGVPPAGDAAAGLDVNLLEERLLRPVLGIRDQRLDPRIDFVGGSGSVTEVARRVDGGEAAVGFTLRPLRVAELQAVADAGAIMPPKSTWFEPKLADGLICYPLD